MPAKVCVVIPTYNRRPLLARAVESVLAQSFQDFELRIIDDGSTDETHLLADQWPRAIYTRQANLSFKSSTAKKFGFAMVKEFNQ